MEAIWSKYTKSKLVIFQPKNSNVLKETGLTQLSQAMVRRSRTERQTTRQ
ncbi:hypothetical protein [Nostoc sp.]